MSVLTLSTQAQRNALVKAIEFMEDILEDRLSEAQSDLASALGASYDLWEKLSKKVDDNYKRVLFARAFNEALGSQPVGASVYLEGLETEVVREALESLSDVSDGGDATLCDVLSVANVQRVIVSTQTAWGATDTEALASELLRQAREALDGDTAAADLLAQLS
jgi:hypothetical protein